LQAASKRQLKSKRCFSSFLISKEKFMKKSLSFRAMLSCIVLAGSLSSAHAFDLSSPDIAMDKPMAQKFAFNGFGCTGENLSPALAWKDAPKDTKSFAIFVHDPDAKTGGAGFWHWAVIDIPTTTISLPQAAGTEGGKMLPYGATLVATDFGSKSYGGPCPPQGDAAHRYVFTVYALKVAKLELPENPTASLTGFMTNANALGSASLTAVYGR
jgi:Raf kinase inhibitor-like YbhB/YbcL family protein